MRMGRPILAQFRLSRILTKSLNLIIWEDIFTLDVRNSVELDWTVFYDEDMMLLIQSR